MRRPYWASVTTEKLQETLDECVAKAPDELAGVIVELRDEIAARAVLPSAGNDHQEVADQGPRRQRASYALRRDG